jgi:methionyl-tRNA formyltransferase
MQLLFFGSPEFSLPSLRALHQSFSIAGVVAQPDRRAGRGRALQPPPVAELAASLDLEVYQPRDINAPDAIDRLRRWKPQVIVVAAYGQILSSEVLSLPELGCINIHASLLPRWRGASPIQAAIKAGDAETGITIMKMDEGMDTGPIIAQRRVRIAETETGGQLTMRLADLGAELVTEVLPTYLEGEIQPIPQIDDLATYAPLLKKADGELDWDQPAEALARQVRAFEPWPTSFFHWQRRRIVVRSASALPGDDAAAGAVTVVEDQPAVVTSEGILCLQVVQPAGKTEMSGAAFLRGAKDFPGSRL